jgi:hypothetical protein
VLGSSVGDELGYLLGVSDGSSLGAILGDRLGIDDTEGSELG